MSESTTTRDQPSSLDALLEHSKIFSLYNGYLDPKEDNLRKILNAVDSSKFPGNLPVAMLAVIGPKGSGKSFLTNFLIQYFQAQGEGGWIAKLVKGCEKGELMTSGFSWDAISSEVFFKPKEHSVACSGIYLWPEPFLMTKAPGQQIVVWIMHIHCVDDKEGVNELEKFLVTVCSRIMEIKWNNDDFRLLEHHKCLETDDQISDPALLKDLCKSIVYVIRSETKRVARSDSEAKKLLLDMMNNTEKTAVYQPMLENFQHVNVKWMKEMPDVLHDNHGLLNSKVMKVMSKFIKDIIQTMVDESEIFPKVEEPHGLTLESMHQYLVNAAKSMLSYKTKTRITETADENSKETVLSHPYSSNTRLNGIQSTDGGIRTPLIDTKVDEASGVNKGATSKLISTWESKAVNKPKTTQELKADFLGDLVANEMGIHQEKHTFSHTTVVSIKSPDKKSDCNEGLQLNVPPSETQIKDLCNRAPHISSVPLPTRNNVVFHHHGAKTGGATPLHVENSDDVGAPKLAEEQFHVLINVPTMYSSPNDTAIRTGALVKSIEAMDVDDDTCTVEAAANLYINRNEMIEMEVEHEQDWELVNKDELCNDMKEDQFQPKVTPYVDVKKQNQREWHLELKRKEEQRQNEEGAEWNDETKRQKEKAELSRLDKEQRLEEEAELTKKKQELLYQTEEEELKPSDGEHPQMGESEWKRKEDEKHQKEEEERKKRDEERRQKEEKERKKRDEERRQKEEKERKKRDEERRQKEEEERKRKEKEEAQARAVMEEVFNTAVTQIQQLCHQSVIYWVNNHLNHHTVDELQTVYATVIKDTAMEHRTAICSSLWHEFHHRLDTHAKNEFHLSSMLENIHTAVSNFTRGVKKQFDLHGFFAVEDKFKQMITDETLKVEKGCGDITEMVKMASVKLTRIYYEHNQLIMKCEDDVFSSAMTLVINVYHEQMKRYLQEAPFVPLKLQEIHSKLVEKLLEAIKNACNLSKSTDGALAAKIAQLKTDFELAFQCHKRTNETKLQKLQAETNKIIQNLKNQYNEKVEEMLKKNEDGLDIKVLGKLHTAIQLEIMKLLEMEIKSKIRQNEPLENYKKNLQSYVDNYWTTVVMVENLKNVKLKKDRDEKEKRERKKEEARQQRLEKEANDKQNRACWSSNSTIMPNPLLQSSLKSEDTRPILPPLVFHLQSSRVVMAMAIGQCGQCEILNNEFGENQTPAMVILTPDNCIVYGSQALGLMDSLRDDVSSFFWSVADFFLHYESPLSKNICFDGNYFSITTEFLLAFLLKKLKQAAEEKLGGRSDIAILAIPIWLSSTQRIRIKDAAQIAGFAQVYLVNEASAAACNFALGESRPEGQGEVLVVTENFDRIDAFVYTYKRAYDNNDSEVKMMAHSSNYDVDEEIDKNRSTVEAFTKGITTGIRRACNYLMPSSSEPVKADKNKVTSSVRRACKQALDYASMEHDGEKIDIKEHLIIMENPDKWESILETVVRINGRKACFFREDTAVMCGSTSLSKNPGEIGKVVRDKLAFEVLRLKYRGESQVITKTYTLPINAKNQTTTLTPCNNEAKFYQRILGNQHIIGELRTREVSYNEQLEPNLNLTNEGIITLDSVMVSTYSGIKCRIAEEQVQWTTPNLARSKIQEQVYLMNSLLQPPPPKEDPAFAKAKTELLKKCQDMTEKLKNGQFKIKSELVKDNVLLMISEARQFGEHENVSLEGIQTQIEKLTKLCEKYERK